jgi:superfamily II DNA/RNA helicase
VHRVGRTGRAESTGSALTLAAPEELRALRALEKAVGVQLQ